MIPIFGVVVVVVVVTVLSIHDFVSVPVAQRNLPLESDYLVPSISTKFAT